MVTLIQTFLILTYLLFSVLQRKLDQVFLSLQYFFPSGQLYTTIGAFPQYLQRVVEHIDSFHELPVDDKLKSVPVNVLIVLKHSEL